MYIIVWKKTSRSSKISLNSPRVRLDSDGTHGLKEFKCLLPSISFLATGHCCTIAKPAKTARAVSNQHMELVLFTYFSKHSNEEHPLAKSNIHERGMSLGPLCTLYMYGMYVIQKTTIMLRTIPKKRNQPKFSKRVCSHFANPPSPPKEQKQYHWKW